MPTSRTRRARRPGPDRQRARRRRDRAERLARSMHELPPEQQALVDELDGFERSGDAAGARRMFEREGGLPSSPAAILDLLEVARLEDVGCAPSWVYDRWVARQAQRWLPRDPAGRLAPALDQTAFAVPPTEAPGPGEDFGAYARRAVDGYYANWLANQIGVFELGGLGAFLAARAVPALTDRARGVRRWVEAPWGVYVAGHLTAGALEVRDLHTHTSTRVVHLGMASEVPVDQAWLGRIVAVDDDPGHLFESPPLPIDETTARTLADGDLSVPRVLAVLRDAVDLGRLPRGFAAREATDLSCELGRRSPFGFGEQPTADFLAETSPGDAEAVAELVPLGVGELELDAILTFDTIGRMLGTSPQAPAGLTPLLVPPIVEASPFEALRRHRTGPRHAEVWRHVHHHTPTFAKPRSRALLDACAD
ncbi:hypothetical protein [Solicola sp. PLA-1-18]|uniref:hypothetical protein n=1 Tax=Solicola sp. PLA-1-18 TaxID=3380532 RepID=UPI003B7A2FD0